MEKPQLMSKPKSKTSDKMIVLVSVGSTFNDHELFCQKLDILLQNCRKENLMLLSPGGKTRTDEMVMRYAVRNKIKYEIHPDHWKSYGRGALFRRNIEIIAEVTHAIFFWDGVGNGTKQFIECAMNRGIPVRVITYRLDTEKVLGF